MKMTHALFIFLCLVMGSCVKKPDSILIIRNIHKVFNDTNYLSKVNTDGLFFDNIHGLKVGQTQLKDLGNNYIKSTRYKRDNDDYGHFYTTTISFEEKNKDELLKYSKNNNICDFSRHLTYEKETYRVNMNFYKNTLVKITINDIPLQFRNEIKLSDENSQGYLIDNSYKEWAEFKKTYWEYSTHKIYNKWKTKELEIIFCFEADTTFYMFNKKQNTESYFSIINVIGYNKYLKEELNLPIIKSSAKDIETSKALDELTQTMILNKSQNKEKNNTENLKSMQKLIEAIEKVDKLLK